MEYGWHKVMSMLISRKSSTVRSGSKVPIGSFSRNWSQSRVATTSFCLKNVPSITFVTSNNTRRTSTMCVVFSPTAEALCWMQSWQLPFLSPEIFAHSCMRSESSWLDSHIGLCWGYCSSFIIRTWHGISLRVSYLLRWNFKYLCFQHKPFVAWLM